MENGDYMNRKKGNVDKESKQEQWKSYLVKETEKSGQYEELVALKKLKKKGKK